MSVEGLPRGPVLAVVAVVVVVVFVAVRACDDEAAPISAASAEAQPPPTPPLMSIPPLEPASPLGTRKEPALSKTTMKRYRLEACYYGSLGVPYAREAYWESLGPEIPSALRIPSFGDYPEHQPRRPGGRPPVAATIGRLPFEQHLRACSSAKSLAGDDDMTALAPALDAFDAYASQVVRTLSDAARYYAREEYERDGFKKGLELHERMSDELAGFEVLHASFGKALASWRGGLSPTADEAKLDPAGKLAREAVAAARVLCDARLSGKPADPEEVKRAAGALRDLGERDAEAVHPRIVGPKLDAFLEAVDAVGPELTHFDRYRIGQAMAELLDADQRALARLLGGEDESFGDRLRPLPPKLRASARPNR